MTDQTTVVTTTKIWWQSRTIWLNGLIVLAALIAFVIDSQTTGTLPFDLDPKWTAFLLGLVNFILRFSTSQPVVK